MEKGNISGRSQIFSGGASKKALNNKLSSTFYGEKDMSYPGGMPGGANKTYDGPEKKLKSSGQAKAKIMVKGPDGKMVPNYAADKEGSNDLLKT